MSVQPEDAVFAIAPATGERLEPGYPVAKPADVEAACMAAAAAFPTYRATRLENRAIFLDAIAEEIMALGDDLILRVMAESGLPRARLEGERGRTCNQLRHFAGVLREGSFLEARIDPALPDRQPAPRPDLRLQNVPLGPVAVFGASNFPLAFSVAGGDTASALAAGCPVVVKAHNAHPGTSRMVADAVHRAAVRCGIPAGTFALIFGLSNEVGGALVADPRIKAVGFTGSRTGGLALMQIAAARPEPIPVYAEMSSINPVLIFPGALAERAEAIGTAFAASLQMGAGQFCTNPGLVIAVDGAGIDAFIASARASIEGAAPQTMLTPAIHAAYGDGIAWLSGHDEVETLAKGGAASGPHQARPMLFQTDAWSFDADERLGTEVFGSASLLVRAERLDDIHHLIAGLEGQLTIAIHMADSDRDAVAAILPLLETKAGRILFNGFGTGVEVSHAMVHGGPFPATSDGRSTSVGSLAIKRFLRLLCYQDMPVDLLPEPLRDDNPLALWRMTDGAMGRA
ncbi:aldehyde dehydrogenase (NADP(+)) [Sphingobium sufflavum]|uniref:aldehyde dehydrogenase (NADP(+)) n=1 Tax=Sphingobium sufflavum TaxID=1129547 RepID=UPI001F3A5E89|nr:aldehyde dehydrogenase (NADP(+)) [Sphingobium sufflavum]MCE7796767.1 aldehyde dehydrogenase (NADP(+)) [Sphingobium sufflavum]